MGGKISLLKAFKLSQKYFFIENEVSGGGKSSFYLIKVSNNSFVACMHACLVTSIHGDDDEISEIDLLVRALIS